MLVWNWERSPIIDHMRGDREGFDRRYQGRIETERNVFVKFRGQWEAYAIVRRGRRRGAEMFLGYVVEPDQLGVLERVRLAAFNRRHPEGRVLPHEMGRSA